MQPVSCNRFDGNQSVSRNQRRGYFTKLFCQNGLHETGSHGDVRKREIIHKARTVPENRLNLNWIRCVIRDRTSAHFLISLVKFGRLGFFFGGGRGGGGPILAWLLNVVFCRHDSRRQRDPSLTSFTTTECTSPGLTRPVCSFFGRFVQT